jgi:hypothetical protein
MSTNTRRSRPGSSPLCSTRPTRCERATEANCKPWPWVNPRRNWPNVAHAYTPPNSRDMPPERITSRSSMHSAPAAIPAIIDVSLPAGFTAADFTLLCFIATLLAINSDRPARSASAITGTSPATDTRFPSSKTGVARDQA